MNSGYDNFSTYYEINVNSQDVPTIFIHGVGLDNTMWQPQKKFFNNFSTVYYDLLNHGKTKKRLNKINFEDFNNQLIELINYLKIDNINLAGFSLGSLIAQHFSAKYNDRINKLIIIASVFDRSKEQISKVKKRYNSSLKGISISDDSIKRWFNSDYIKSNPLVYKYFFELLENNDKKDFLSAYKLFVESDKYKIDFTKIKSPTLIMTGENEIGSTPHMSKMLSKRIKNSKLFIVKKAKHMATYEKSKIVNFKINEFIK